MANLTDKVAVVTGAARGIGAAIAKALAAAGAAAVVNYAGSKEAAARVVDDIKGNGGRAIAVQGDVSKAADVSRLFAEAKAAFGAIDILVNNAGVARMSPLEAVTEDLYRRLFDTNVLGPVLTIKEALAHFSANGGSVINVGSVVSVSPTPGSTVYAATKGGWPLNSAADASASTRWPRARSRPTPRAPTGSSAANSGKSPARSGLSACFWTCHLTWTIIAARNMGSGSWTSGLGCGASVSRSTKRYFARMTSTPRCWAT